MSTPELTVTDPDFPVCDRNRSATLATREQEAAPAGTGFTHADGQRFAAEILGFGRKLAPGPLSTPYESTGHAVLTSPLPAEAVRRPYAGHIPAPTQKGLPL